MALLTVCAITPCGGVAAELTGRDAAPVALVLLCNPIDPFDGYIKFLKSLAQGWCPRKTHD
jgi:hypothetical protein